MSAAGRSVRLYLVDGTATGILTAEIMNWTGHVLAAPRTRFEDAFLRDELKRTGIYFLLGPDDDGSDLTKVYVGEGDEIGRRLYLHNKEKDFWERFIAITSKDMNLTKAHVRYLEGRILRLLVDARKVKIANKDMPQFDLLPEADISDMEAFLEEVQLVLPVIGAEFLRKPIKKARDSKSFEADAVSNASSPISIGLSQEITFVLSNEKAGINAVAREEGGEFIVLEDSIGSMKERVSFNERNKSARDEAFETGRIEQVGDKNFILKQDIPFSSPSAASVFLFGTSRNGRTDWIVEGHEVSYGSWKDQMIESMNIQL